MIPSISGIRLGAAAVILGSLLLALFVYRGLYHREEAKIATMQTQLAALQAGYSDEVHAANACAAATADAHTKLVEKQALIDEVKTDATQQIAASAKRSTAIISTVDTGKSCEKAVEDYIASYHFRRSH